MNLVEKLLNIDKGEFNKEKTEKVHSKVLSQLLGECVQVTLKSIDPQQVLEISSGGLDEYGDPVLEKSLEVNQLLVAAAMIDPPVKDEGLLKHLGVATPQQAVAKLFKGEVNKLAIRVQKMAGFDIDTNSDEEIKN